MRTPPTLFCLCGKMAAGKSTLSRQLAERAGAVLLVQPHIRALLAKGVSVVLDFAGNTRGQRAWFRELVEARVRCWNCTTSRRPTRCASAS